MAASRGIGLDHRAADHLVADPVRPAGRGEKRDRAAPGRRSSARAAERPGDLGASSAGRAAARRPAISAAASARLEPRRPASAHRARCGRRAPARSSSSRLNSSRFDAEPADRDARARPPRPRGCRRRTGARRTAAPRRTGTGSGRRTGSTKPNAVDRAPRRITRPAEPSSPITALRPPWISSQA